MGIVESVRESRDNEVSLRGNPKGDGRTKENEFPDVAFKILSEFFHQ